MKINWGRGTFLTGLFLLAVVTACQNKPTQIASQEPILAGIQSPESIEKIMVMKPVILDARSPFDFNLYHVPGAINVNWRDFSQQGANNQGLLQSDLFAAARRLSLYGIDPSTPVLVLGLGLQGQGEEGRIAWMLKVLGVQQVYTSVHTSLRALNPKEETPVVKNKPPWKPVQTDSLDISLNKLRALATGHVSIYNLSSRARSMALTANKAKGLRIPGKSVFGIDFYEVLKKLIILDVRSLQEFNLKNIGQDSAIKAAVVNLEWKHFIDEAGQVRFNVLKELTAKNITPDKVIIVISNHGVRSAAVTYALRTLGFNHSLNFSGGYEQWFAAY